MARFIAIPVGQGDAFYLELSEGSCLVDGGKSRTYFAELFRRCTRKDGVDVLIVTHNDADHASGILGFLEAGLGCHEVWLPGRWAQVLPYALRPWEEVVALLVEGVEALGNEVRLAEHVDSVFEQYGEQVRNVIEWEEGGQVECDERGWPQEMVASLEKYWLDEDLLVVFPAWYLDQDVYFYVWPWRYPFDEQRWYLFREALVAAARIRQIAMAAFHRGVRVRWFQYSTNPAGGNQWLRPLSAREIVAVPIVRLRGRSEGEEFFLLLSLTTVNKESLVFWSSPEAGSPGVLFTGDSDLEEVVLPSAHKPIVTTPHHGSAANAQAYARVQSVIRDAIWIRSDGNYRSRPCPEFLQQSLRFCTLCRGGTHAKQKVTLFMQRGRWKRAQGVTTCVCV
ncbi:MAG: MBL fold metallo-hydrolase [Thermogemmata sp.]|nr:MBL fold metallo-hydrolase [Thermogemmata sp.]